MDQRNAEDLIQAYQEGKRDFSNLDLSGLSIFEANMPEVNFQGSCLRLAYLPYGQFNRLEAPGVDLQGSELGDIQLYQANLSHANLSQAKLVRANLRSATLAGASLVEANLQGADLRYADLRGADLRRANLSQANLDQANLSDAHLEGANLFRATGVAVGTATFDFTTVHPDGHQHHIDGD
ncbi:pentapeptide repeat-containing protein [Candidatus Synechococcus calcipolaris G9]|uniref:Pentapeptide repeat-containing protein n=1 Tax=Candidatus Synechococcus calcipolaris G9 TaxID=1497997 RepID=A0ABT6EXK9_9SYNE|nr:pentapeptide repeat-containing protein [Candidatus Synechococcus calcipolaris]MDG2990521.1 pentapeptide repeat-containing protein [Candidatus Synechococcus calcipolaris G9]